MYSTFFGLRERPFDLTPDPRYLLLTPHHREALATLRYGLESRKGILALTGEAGTGKTTLLHAALATAGRNGLFVHLTNPRLTREEFLEFLADAFALSRGAVSSKARLILDLERVLRERQAAGDPCVLIVDEAQCLPDDLLEEVRLLANIETEQTKLLSVILAGQPELAERLSTVGLRQLKQRVALRCSLAPLELRETAAYIAGRIRIAGGTAASVFTQDAVRLIHEASRGIPRWINVICDNALVSGFAADEKPVGRALVDEVCVDLDLRTGPDNARAPHAPATSAPPAASRQLDGHAGAVDGDPGEAEPEVRSAVTAGMRPTLFAQNTPARRRFHFFS